MCPREVWHTSSQEVLYPTGHGISTEARPAPDIALECPNSEAPKGRDYRPRFYLMLSSLLIVRKAFGC